MSDERPTNQNIATDCFVCGTDNPLSLHAQFVSHPEVDEVWGYFTPLACHQSYPDRVHGGVLSAVIDETIGRTITVRQPDVFGVTVKLETKFRRPTPYGQRLTCRGRLTSLHSRTFEGEAQIFGPDGKVCVEGKALYLIVPKEQFCDAESWDRAWKHDERPIPDLDGEALGGGRA